MSESQIEIGFVLETLSVPIDRILPSRKTPEDITENQKFRQIRASIEEVGLIEPLSIFPASKNSEQYLLLDGHLRLLVLTALGATHAPCLVAKDDEDYTFNTRINRLSTIQEHCMIKRAIDRGLPRERLAKALNVDLSHIDKRLTLLDGICPEAGALLKDRQFSPMLSRVIRKMKPLRQVECVELMVSAKRPVSDAEALLAATPVEMLVDGKKPEKMRGVTQEQMSKMEREMSNLQAQYKAVEITYGRDMVNLMMARGYLVKLLKNMTVAKHLKQRHSELLDQFESIIETTSLEGTAHLAQSSH